MELSAEYLKGKSIELKLKNGNILIGCLPVKSNDIKFEDNFFYFLPWDKHKDFFSKIKGEKINMNDEIKKFLTIINREEIDSFEILESEINNMKTENGKPIPLFSGLKWLGKGKPGHLTAQYQIPGKSKWFELGELKIKNKTLILPITLVFVSYAKEDKNAVTEIIDKLNDIGILTWFDENELLPGDDWETKIETAIKKADYVLVFLSSKTIDKIGYKNKEVKYALEQYALMPSGKRYIIPVLLDDCEPPREFSKIQWLKAWKEGWFKLLSAALGKLNDI